MSDPGGAAAMSARSPSGRASTVTVACSIPSYHAARHGLVSTQAEGSPSLRSTGTTRIGSERRCTCGMPARLSSDWASAAT